MTDKTEIGARFLESDYGAGFSHICHGYTGNKSCVVDIVNNWMVTRLASFQACRTYTRNGTTRWYNF